MKLEVLAVLTTVVASRAEIAYQGGLYPKGPLSSCSYNENFNPPGLYNQLGSPWPGKYPDAQTFSNVPATLQNGGVSNPSALCSCIPNTEGSAPLVAGPPWQLLGGRAVSPGGPVPSRFAFPAEYAAPPGLPPTPPTVLASPIPSAPDFATIGEAPNSHIMKIPRKSDSSSITITLTEPEAWSSSNSNTVYSSLPPPPASFTYPPRPVFFTRPPPLLASCPATVFYPATIPYSVYPPPFTCPAPLPSQPPPNITPSPFRPTQPFQPSSSALPSTTTKPDSDTIASFTTNIPDTKLYNVSIAPEKRDPLLTFKLLSAAANKPPGVPYPPSPSLTAAAASSDCSMPIPPVTV